MKTIKLFFAVLAMSFLISCSGDDSPSEINPSMIHGEWRLQTFEYSGNSSSQMMGQTHETSYAGEARDIEVFITFNEDNTFSSRGRYVLALETNGETDNINVEDMSSSGNYRVNGNKLVTSNAIGEIRGQNLYNPAGESEGEIVELSDNRMVLAGDNSVTMNETGQEISVTNSFYYVLTR